MFVQTRLTLGHLMTLTTLLVRLVSPVIGTALVSTTVVATIGTRGSLVDTLALDSTGGG